MSTPPASAPRVSADSRADVEELERAVTHSLEEARMVLPGLQALFGFQLVAVFSDRFEVALSEGEQRAHLAALLLVGVAIALIMTPAAYHRQVEDGRVSHHLLRVVSVLVAAALVPLMFGLGIDVYLVTRVITGSTRASAWIAGLLLALLGALWFVYPRLRARVRDA
jgi:hypothetical protein